MSKNLVIVESPTKSKVLKKFLGREFEVEASLGHIKDLPKSKLGVDIDKNFTPQYVLIKGKKKIVEKLKKEASTAEKVYLAPDPDREGEAIAWHIAAEIKKTNPQILRASFNEITKPAVLNGIKAAGKLDLNKVEAQQARRILDRLVGYQVSPILWKTIFRGLSAGRVQSAALRMVCEREEAILNFAPQEYWSIEAVLENKKQKSFKAGLFKINEKDFVIKNQAEAEKIVSDLKNKTFIVDKIESSTQYRNPYPPYTTSTLQQDASRRLSFSSQKTMVIAQQLYEGVELGEEGSQGLITYMRTDSVRIAATAAQACRKFIATKYDDRYLPAKSPHYKSKKLAQEAHEAIRPTYVELTPEEVKQYLNKDQFRLYELIWRRFVASQMSSAIYAVITANISADQYLFRATSSQLEFEGFLRVYEIIKEENGEEEQENKLPDLSEREKLKLLSLTPEQHFTRPPARFSEASLIKELEANGIGRPSTYAVIMTTLKNRKYVNLEKRRLIPSELGIMVNKILVQNFPKIFNIDFTAHMEEDLDEIEEGRIGWVEVLKEFYKPFSATLKKVEGQKINLKKMTEEKTDEICEKCGSAMIIKWGKHGKFLACSKFPECKNTKTLNGDGEVEENQIQQECEKCGGRMIIKTGRFGKFLACSNYPECKNTKPYTLGIPCPEGCGGELTERRSKRGRIFYSCSRYPKCKFATWYKPVLERCPSCQAPFMLLKSNKSKGEHLFCLKCGQEKALSIVSDAVI